MSAQWRVADKLNAEGLRPGRASGDRSWSVVALLRSVVYHDRTAAAGCARYWKMKGYSLRKIGQKLLEASRRPKCGGQWHAHQVQLLLIEERAVPSRSRSCRAPRSDR